jgi:hypothetical protein
MRRYEILIGFLLGTAVWAGVMVLQSDASLLHQICETNQYTDHENCAPHHPLYVALYYIGYAINPATLAVAATVAIAVFTYTLYGATKGLVEVAEIQSADMKRSIAAAQMAATAADLSAKAAIAIELPIFTARPEGLGWDSERVGDAVQITSFSLNHIIFFNAGRTKAVPLELRLGYVVGDHLPSEPTYPLSKPFSVGCLIESDPFSKRIDEFTFKIEPGTYGALRTSTTRLWFYCELIYLDFMKTRHESGFCWEIRSNPTSTSGIRDDETPAYNRHT